MWMVPATATIDQRPISRCRSWARQRCDQSPPPTWCRHRLSRPGDPPATRVWWSGRRSPIQGALARATGSAQVRLGSGPCRQAC
jgi:hypothetical protein